jgi:hypothetical protein
MASTQRCGTTHCSSLFSAAENAAAAVHCPGRVHVPLLLHPVWVMWPLYSHTICCYFEELAQKPKHYLLLFCCPAG